MCVCLSARANRIVCDAGEGQCSRTRASRVYPAFSCDRNTPPPYSTTGAYGSVLIWKLYVCGGVLSLPASLHVSMTCVYCAFYDEDVHGSEMHSVLRKLCDSISNSTAF